VPVRLAGAVKNSEGRIETFIGGLWAGVTYSGVGSGVDAFVTKACVELGFKRGRAFRGNVFTPSGLPIWGNVYCRGNETSIMQCTWSYLNLRGGGIDDINAACTNSTTGRLQCAFGRTAQRHPLPPTNNGPPCLGPLSSRHDPALLCPAPG